MAGTPSQRPVDALAAQQIFAVGAQELSAPHPRPPGRARLRPAKPPSAGRISVLGRETLRIMVLGQVTSLYQETRRARPELGEGVCPNVKCAPFGLSFVVFVKLRILFSGFSSNYDLAHTIFHKSSYNTP